ncbi:MAG TPA: HlyC/CorC family transporter [Methylophilaceae bacterium]
MDSIPVPLQFGILILLLSISAFFSIAETSLMSLNRYRMRHLANEGHRGAKLARKLLSQTDKLLGVILLGNTLCIAASSTIVTVLTVQLFGEGEWILMIGTLAITFAILVFSEISPKVIAAAYPEKIGFACSYLLYPLLWLFNPVVTFVNLFVSAFVRLLGIKLNFSESMHAVTTEELKSIVTEAGSYIPKKNRTILLNLFDLESATVDDVMTAHTQIEAIDLDQPIEEMVQKLSTSNHTRLPVRRSSGEEIVGILHLRKIMTRLRDGDLTVEDIEEVMKEPYFIPASTPLYTQMQQFQEHRRRIALVVDEYGELKGLITIEDILEEIIGDFTAQSPLRHGSYRQEEDGSWIVDGSASLRDLNKKLGFEFPLDGPKTMNGLVLEHFEDIPEPNTSFKIGIHALEVLQTQDRVVKSVRIYA